MVNASIGAARPELKPVPASDGCSDDGALAGSGSGEGVVMAQWSFDEACKAYGVPHWGAPYFSIGSSGQVCVHPDGDSSHATAMGDLVNKLVEQGFRPPLVLRFPQIIGHRLQLIQTAFDEAIDATFF